MVFLGVLGAEQALFAPEEAISGVLVAAHVENCWGHQQLLSNEAACCRDRLMGAGLEIEGGDMRQHPLACEPATANPLALFGH